MLQGKHHDRVAKQMITELLDDIDGSVAAETVSFALDGVSYEIDLSVRNARALRSELTRWQQAARHVGGRRVAPLAVPTAVDTRAVRAWAASNGVQVPNRGRIPNAVIEHYRAAGN